MAKLVITFFEELFQKWGLDFIRPNKLASKMSSNQYIIMAANHATKWVEAWTFHNNTNVITTKFFYNHILMRFGYMLKIMIDQGTHFINDGIKYLIDHFITKHTNFIDYYPQGNGQVEFTNKVFGTLLTKLINEKKND